MTTTAVLVPTVTYSVIAYFPMAEFIEATGLTLEEARPLRKAARRTYGDRVKIVPVPVVTDEEHAERESLRAAYWEADDRVTAVERAYDADAATEAEVGEAHVAASAAYLAARRVGAFRG